MQVSPTLIQAPELALTTQGRNDYRAIVTSSMSAFLTRRECRAV